MFRRTPVSSYLRLLSVASLVGVFLWGTPRTIRADEPSEAEIKQFRKHLADGARHFKKKQYYPALEDFEKARDIADPPSLQYKLARVYQEVGRCEESKKWYRRFLEEDVSDDKKKRGNQRIEELDESCPKRGTLDIQCRPSDASATIVVGDRERSCPGKLALEPGDRTVRVRSESHPDFETTETVRAGTTTSLAVDLEARNSSPARSGWSTLNWIQVGGGIAGVGLLTGGVVSDLSARDRLDRMARADRNRNASRLQRLSGEADAAFTRTVVFYVAGGVLTLGSATWLTVDLMSAAPASASLEFGLTPAGATGRLRW